MNTLLSNIETEIKTLQETILSLEEELIALKEQSALDRATIKQLYMQLNYTNKR